MLSLLGMQPVAQLLSIETVTSHIWAFTPLRINTPRIGNFLSTKHLKGIGNYLQLTFYTIR